MPLPAARLKTLITNKCRRPIVQQLIEDSFNSIKKHNGKKANTVCTGNFAMASVLDDRVLTSKHRYDEVNRHVEFPERNAQLPSDANQAVLKKPKLPQHIKDLDLASITGFKDADWFSPGAPGMSAPYADLEACRAAHDVGKLNALGERNWCRLISKDVLIRHRDSTEWLLGVGNIDGSVGVAWPVEELGNGLFQAKKGDATSVLITILDISEWQAMPVRWVAPMHRAVMEELAAAGKHVHSSDNVKLKGSSHYPAGIFSIAVEVTGAAVSLLRCAALQGFWTLPLTYLREIADRLGLEYPDVSLLSIIETLVKLAIPDITTEHLISILDRRGCALESELDDAEELTSLEWVTDSFDKQFADQFRAELQDAKTMKINQETFISDLTNYKVSRAPHPCHNIVESSVPYIVQDFFSCSGLDFWGSRVLSRCPASPFRAHFHSGLTRVLL